MALIHSVVLLTCCQCYSPCALLPECQTCAWRHWLRADVKFLAAVYAPQAMNDSFHQRLVKWRVQEQHRLTSGRRPTCERRQGHVTGGETKTITTTVCQLMMTGRHCLNCAPTSGHCPSHLYNNKRSLSFSPVQQEVTITSEYAQHSVHNVQQSSSHAVTAKHSIMISSPYGSPIILVSGDITCIPKFEGGHPAPGRWMRVGWVRIGDFRPISRRISETVRDTTKVTITH